MKICIPLNVKSKKSLFEQIKKANLKGDLLEVWLDPFEDDLNLKGLLKDINEKSEVPLLFVCKGTDEKGVFKGTEKSRVNILLMALDYGDYIDIGLKTDKKLIQEIFNKAKEKKKKVIVSFHDFEKSLTEKILKDIVLDSINLGANICKIAVKINKPEENEQLLRLVLWAKKKGIKIIVIGMGKAGVLTRVLTPLIGGYLMFAPLTKKGLTASGQLTVDELRMIWGEK